MGKQKLELLAPAANADIAIQAILHGADAVYIGASSHGARKSASNSIEDIAKVVNFAHQFRAKVYVTVNTIVYDNELGQVKALCNELYHIGVDALIVQDMALLDMDLPPIPLHASTQCDIRSPQKALFLQNVGFSQLVLARELTIKEIRAITDVVTVPVECFIHGALCVSYSGRCHASCATMGRSANRGECAQICRLPYTLTDARGKVIAEDKYLLSLHDLNASARIEDLIDAGVSSFKIEGRLKDLDYVKNVVAYYRQRLDDIIAKHPERYERSSYGISSISFIPDLNKSFNRGFTDYFLSTRYPANLASIFTPKSMGEVVTDLKMLRNGDGISFFDRSGIYQGANINRIEDDRIITGRNTQIPSGIELHRTYNVEWQKKLARPTADRKIALNIILDNNGVTAEDERGVKIRLRLDVIKEKAKNDMDYRNEFSKLGNTCYKLNSYTALHDVDMFIPRSEINKIRHQLIKCLDQANLTTYPFELRRCELPGTVYPYRKLDFRDNVANRVAEDFYRRHGVMIIEKALEAKTTAPEAGTVVMTTRHCVLRELGLCKKEKRFNFEEPLKLSGAGLPDFHLKFNCAQCEMEVLLSSQKKSVNRRNRNM